MPKAGPTFVHYLGAFLGIEVDGFKPDDIEDISLPLLQIRGEVMEKAQDIFVFTKRNLKRRSRKRCFF